MSERGELKRMKAKAHKNSGRGVVKGDGSTDRFVIDVKEYANSFGLSREVWAKICTDALRVDRNKSPLLQLVLGTTHKTRLAVIEWSELEYLLEQLEDK